ncbi:MAG: putative 2OG-Fe(II) oxygenase [Rhizomicrobium sp.]
MRWQIEPGWGVLDGMLKLAQIAAERNPGKADNWRTLVLTQHQAGRAADIEDSLQRAAAALGGDLAGRRSFITLLLSTGELDRAVDEAEALFADAPQDAETYALLKSALTEAGARDRLNELGVQRDEILQISRFALNEAWETAKSDADLRALVAKCRAALATNPADAGARCFLAHGLAQLGERAEATALMASTNLLSVGDLRIPGEFDSRESFCAALADEIRHNPTLIPDPKRKATRNGRQAMHIGLKGEAALDILLRQIKHAVDDYARERQGGADPYVSQPPASVRLSSWAVIFNGTTGRQTAHMHPSGWLSGVFYVTAPREPETERHSGALLVGSPIRGLSAAAPWDITPIEPVPGRIVLFPSFVTHATEPCKVPGERICVAFDVVPTQAGHPAGETVVT